MPAPDYMQLHASFASPIARLDCGDKCAPYNENHIPFCCDAEHAIPTAYPGEWEYLEVNTDLWHTWQGETGQDTRRLQDQTPPGHTLIVCQGHAHCQRGFRSLTCRAFPFFPYFDSQNQFLGLSYYWEYEERCWVISNLSRVTPAYVAEFIGAFTQLFEALPGEAGHFVYHSSVMRSIFQRRRRTIPLLHRNGGIYTVSPGSERLRRVDPTRLPRFGPYKIAALLPFPGEE